MATTYKILTWSPEKAAWVEVADAQIEAAGARTAVKEWAAEHNATGTYVAIPMRSFKPVKAEPATGVKLSNA